MGVKKERQIINTLPVWRILADLRGVAILGVVLSHSLFLTLYNLIGNSSVPKEKQFSLEILVFIQELTRFAVPLFIFLAGHFLANAPVSITSTWGRSKKLIYPYVFWCLVGWLWSHTLVPELGKWDFKEFLLKFLKGDVHIGYFFTPLILQYYFIAIFVQKPFKKKPWSWTLIALFIQAFAMLWNYYSLYYQNSVTQIKEWMFPRFVFYFFLGMWVGSNASQIKEIVVKNRRKIIIFCILSGILLILESRLAFFLLFKMRGRLDLVVVVDAMAPWKITTAFWAVAFIFTLFVIWFKLGKRVKPATKLGNIAFIIYMIHAPTILIVGKVLAQFELCRNNCIAYFSVIFSLGLIIPILITLIIRRSLPILRTIILGD